MRLFTAAIAGLALAPEIYAFYLPGAAPHNYAEGERVDLFVNALTPMLAGTDDSKLASSKHLFILVYCLIGVILYPPEILD